MTSHRPLIDVAAAAANLLTSLRRHPPGQVSPSVYETGRIVSFAPWLAGHENRLHFLAATQRADGAWGGPDGYALGPTLSATEAMLSTLARRAATVTPSASAVAAAASAERGLTWLDAWLRGRPSTPDLPAAELIVPALIAAINGHLVRAAALPDLQHRPGLRLPVPAPMSTERLARITATVAAGGPLPEKLLHALEVAGASACAAPSVRPTPDGIVGASPAAAAAWLGPSPAEASDPSRRYLEAIIERTGGPVPCASPITVFERAWVLGDLARAGILGRAPGDLVASLAAALGERGAPGGAGLPPDADTTAVTLSALAQLGVVADLDCLWEFETPTHFCTWPGEQGVSPSVNAHVLDAFGARLSAPTREHRRIAATVQKVGGWLREQQHSDGRWVDRWHASPYYATACCALALDRYGGDASSQSVRRAAGWVLRTQRPDGSWGCWRGTVEETAYALQVLLNATRAPVDDETVEAAARGYVVVAAGLDDGDHLPLWHDKDLYAPTAIIRAAAVAAVHAAQRNARVIDRTQRSRSIEHTSRTG